MVTATFAQPIHWRRPLMALMSRRVQIVSLREPAGAARMRQAMRIETLVAMVRVLR